MSTISDSFLLIKNKNFSIFLFSRFILTIAIQMQSLLVGWQVYELTKDPLSLGLIGLTEVIPFVASVLFAGHIADIFNRKKIIITALVFYLFTSLGLLLLSTNSFYYVYKFGIVSIYILIGLTGIIRAFLGPSYFALLAQLIPKKDYSVAVSLNSGVWHIAAVVGPALGGFIFSVSNYEISYEIIVVLFILSFLSAFFLPGMGIEKNSNSKEPIFKSISRGIKFVFGHKIILPAISLDLFAVLFGGAIALLPIYADQILHVGASGLGWLRAAPAMGAVAMAIVLAFYPPLKNAGIKLLISVIAFGICIILFGVSENFYVSFLALLLSGAVDNISVVIRHTIIQLLTPDDMRGRVSAVNSVFISSSNEFGQFESGIAAKLLGTVTSVVFGGCATIAVVLGINKIFPELKNLQLNKHEEAR